MGVGSMLAISACGEQTTAGGKGFPPWDGGGLESTGPEDGEEATSSSSASSGPDPTTTVSGEPMPPPTAGCEDGFELTPFPLVAGEVGYVSFSHPEPLFDVDLLVTGPGEATVVYGELAQANPWVWTWAVTPSAPGPWTFAFGTGDPQHTIAACEHEVSAPPQPPPLPPTENCAEDQVCGDIGPQGASCERCPMVGECLEPPSPFGPSGPGRWSCLDSASCLEEDGVCRIWCPGEPCDMQLHPEGCPQGVEACFVDAGHLSYEDACKACCESRFHEPTGEYACWDSAMSLCRYPGDCGTPLP